MSADAVEIVPCRRCSETERRLARSHAVNEELAKRNEEQAKRIADLEGRGRDYDRIVGVGLELARLLAACEAERDRLRNERDESAALLSSARALFEEAMLFGNPRFSKRGELLGFLADTDWTKRAQAWLTALFRR